MALRAIIFPGTLPRRISHGCHGRRFCTMAFPSADCRTALHRRATRLVAVRLCLSATLRQRLLFQPAAQPFSAALRLRTQGRADRPPGRLQPADRLPSARRLVQGGHPGSPPPHGRPAPRQAAATLCRPYRRIHADPWRRHPLRHPRLHRPHLGRTRVHGGLVPFLQEVRPRSRHAAQATAPRPSPEQPTAEQPTAEPAPRAGAEQLPAEPCRLDAVPPSQPVPLPPPPFSRRRRTTRNTRGPSC